VFKTIKTQMLLLSAALVLLLLSQVLLSRSTQSTFVNSLDLTQQALAKVSLVRKLERDIIDLQRNVLIYKEFASESAINRFNLLMKENQINLTQLDKLTSKDKNSNVYSDYITRMRNHLNDYKENFSDVITVRTKRQELHNTHLLSEFESILNNINNHQGKAQPALDTLKNAKYHIARAENFLLQYLQTPEQQLISPFQQHVLLAKIQIEQHLGSHKDYQVVLDNLIKAENDVLKLTQITKGYFFLVNVVMAGSANEFLFLARKLDTLVTKNVIQTNIGVKKTLYQARIGSDLFSLVGIILATAAAFFLAYRIMLPINFITSVFQKLANGEYVDSIPSLKRKDEIGLLAQAADVFRKTNNKTTTLLRQSQLSNVQQKLLNSRLVESNKKVEQATASKSMFLANMSHEIRTPMNGIIGMLEIVLRSELSQSQREQLNNASYSGQILMRLINDILDFSKIEAGKLDIESTEFTLESLFVNMLADISSRAQEKKLNVKFNANPDLPVQLIGDSLRISQVLLNIYDNAIKFTQNGHVSINVDFQPHDNPHHIKLLIEVADTGIGMNSEQVTKIFDSFTQADGSTSRNYGGSGLGLSIVTQLVKLMQGSVTVESEENQGSTFKVNIVLKKTNNNTKMISELSISNGKLYYFSEGRRGFLNIEYVEKTGLNYHHLPLSNLLATLDDINSDDVVILDIKNQLAYKSYQETIDKLVSNSKKVGFITHSQPRDLHSQLTTIWPVECLSQPFTPQQASNFLKELFVTGSKTNISRTLFIYKHEVTQYQGHVLLVEDNSINQAVSGEMLRQLGLTFDIAEDGQQAVTKIANSLQYDLIFMDIQMPIMDGYEATRKLREIGPDSLIICGLSANAMIQDYEKATQAGMNDYIVKPIKHKTLEKLVAKYLPKKSA
jgi:signal transduction histidine kinase/CheY-like chemotaxis protein